MLHGPSNAKVKLSHPQPGQWGRMWQDDLSGLINAPIKKVGSASTRYFHPDHMRSTTVLTHGSGVQEERLLYYP